MEPKNSIWFVAALSWSLMIVVLSLVQFTSIPDVGVPSADKYVHSLFHFVFTILWFYNFYKRRVFPFASNLILVLTLSVCLGVIVEFAQGLTETRSAELEDIWANCFGSGLAAVFIITYFKLIAKNT